MSNVTRRKFLTLAALSVPGFAGLDACLVEPKRLRVKNLDFVPNGRCRFVQFSDLHYRGDANQVAEVVAAINGLKPEFVCFTGDLIEHNRYVPEALSLIREIQAPVYGAPGNH